MPTYINPILRKFNKALLTIRITPAKIIWYLEEGKLDYLLIEQRKDFFDYLALLNGLLDGHLLHQTVNQHTLHFLTYCSVQQ